MMLKLLAALLLGQSVSLPVNLKVAPGDLVIVPVKYDGTVPKWELPGELKEWSLEELYEWKEGSAPSPKGKILKAVLPDGTPTPAGDYKIRAWNSKRTKDSSAASPMAYCTVTVIGTPKPPPTPPPDPGPTPPPGPTPNPAPLPEPGFRVMILYESSTLGKLPLPQYSALYAKELKDYLLAKCVKAPDGEAERRIWDKDVDPTNVGPIWQKALSVYKAEADAGRGALPWLLISNGTTGYKGPFPANLQEAMKLLRQYGG